MEIINIINLRLNAQNLGGKIIMDNNNPTELIKNIIELFSKHKELNNG